MAKIRICKEPGCRNAQTTDGFCRLHYLRNWKTIKQKHQKRSAERLNSYVESICKRHPDRYLEAIKEDLRSKKFEKEWVDRYTNELDDLYRIFNDPNYNEEVGQLIRDLRADEE